MRTLNLQKLGEYIQRALDRPIDLQSGFVLSISDNHYPYIGEWLHGLGIPFRMIEYVASDKRYMYGWDDETANLILSNVTMRSEWTSLEVLHSGKVDLVCFDPDDPSVKRRGRPICRELMRRMVAMRVLPADDEMKNLLSEQGLPRWLLGGMNGHVGVVSPQDWKTIATFAHYCRTGSANTRFDEVARRVLPSGVVGDVVHAFEETI